MKVNQFFFGSIDEHGYKVHFLPRGHEKYEEEIAKRFEFFGGIDKLPNLNVHSTFFRVHDRFVLATYTIKGEDTFGRKDVLFGRGILLTMEECKQMGYSPYPYVRKINVNEIEISSLQQNFEREIELNLQDGKEYFDELSQSIAQDKYAIKKLKEILPSLWSGVKLKLNFSEENIWLIELIYAFSPVFTKGSLSFSTQINRLSDVLIFSVSLTTGANENISFAEGHRLVRPQEKYLEQVYMAFKNNDYAAYQKALNITSFETQKGKIMEMILRLFVKTTKNG